jgi:hypothetical protein
MSIVIDGTNTLSDEEVVSIILGKKAFLWIPRYYPPQLAEEIGNRFRASPNLKFYRDYSELARWGITYAETVGPDGEPNENLLRRYQETAIHLMDELAHICAPYVSPQHRILLEFLKVWRPGIALASLDGRYPLSSGVVHVVIQGGEILPHRDRLRNIAPQYEAPYTVRTQVSAVIALRSAEIGGQVQVWSQKLSDEQYDELRLQRSYGLDRMKLGAPYWSRKLEPGDLLIFNTDLVHGASFVKLGELIFWQCFIGFREFDLALWLWS